MVNVLSQLGWIDAQAARMRKLLVRFAEINSGSTNMPGLARMADEVERTFAHLAPARRHNLPPRRVVDAAGRVVRQPVGQALAFTCRPRARRRVLLAIHMDTVYGEDDPFQRCVPLGRDRLRGPGVADAKGGLLVMLVALEALERSGLADGLGWRVIVNADEELGSPGSAGLLQRAARRCEIGLVFEPALPDGALVSQRKGSGNFALVVRGRAAHAGRSFEHGRNALTAMARAITQLEALSAPMRGLTVNVARVEGGGPANQVPDLGIVRFNVRYARARDQAELQNRFDAIVASLEERDGIRAQLHGAFGAPPKPLDPPHARLLAHVQACGRSLGMDLPARGTGGVCDGNRLAAAGLPTIDTLGVCGDHLHSPREFVWLDSLAQRARLTALLLMKLAVGEIGGVKEAAGV